jgi:hypothetical protein
MASKRANMAWAVGSSRAAREHVELRGNGQFGEAGD